MPTTRSLLLFLLIVWLARLATIGAYPLMDSTEGRYADIAREMVVSGAWVMPPLDPGVPFWGKPPVSFWVTGAAYLVAGVNEWSARLQGYLFTLVTAIGVFGIGATLGGRRLGLFCAAVYSSFVLTFAMAASTLADPALGCFLTLALLGLVRHVRSAPRWTERSFVRRRLPGWGVGAALGLAVLSKGLLAIVLFGIAGVAWLAASRQWRPVLRFPWISAALIALAVALPWHLAAEEASPGFLEYYIVGEHFQRYVDDGWEGDRFGNPPEAPYGMIWAFALLAVMPWPLLALTRVRPRRVRAAWRAITTDPALHLCLWWAAAPLLLFSLSQNSAEHYTVPVTPAAAVIIACWLGRAGRRENHPAPDAAPTPPRAALLRVGLWPTGRLTWAFLGAVPALGLVASVTVLPRVAAERSQLETVLLFDEETRGEHDAELIYFEELPQSADFYSEGAARMVPDITAALVLPLLEDDTRHIFALDEEEEVRAFARVPTDERFEVLGVVGDYTLMAEIE